jgi:hypothetical protein
VISAAGRSSISFMASLPVWRRDIHAQTAHYRQWGKSPAGTARSLRRQQQRALAVDRKYSL